MNAWSTVNQSGEHPEQGFNVYMVDCHVNLLMMDVSIYDFEYTNSLGSVY